MIANILCVEAHALPIYRIDPSCHVEEHSLVAVRGKGWLDRIVIIYASTIELIFLSYVEWSAGLYYTTVYPYKQYSL